MEDRTIKDVFIATRKVVDINCTDIEENDFFLCNVMCMLDETDGFGWNVIVKALDYFNKNKPSEKQYTEFYDDKYFKRETNCTVWWKIGNARDNGEIRKVLMTKRRFLNVLIKQLK